MRMECTLRVVSTGYKLRILHAYELPVQKRLIVLYKLSPRSPYLSGGDAERELTTREDINVNALCIDTISEYILAPENAIVSKNDNVRIISRKEDIPEFQQMNCIFSHKFTEENELLKEIIVEGRIQGRIRVSKRMKHFAWTGTVSELKKLKKDASIVSTLVSNSNHTTEEKSYINFLVAYAETILSFKMNDKLPETVYVLALQHFNLDEQTVKQLQNLYDEYGIVEEVEPLNHPPIQERPSQSCSKQTSFSMRSYYPNCSFFKIVVTTAVIATAIGIGLS